MKKYDVIIIGGGLLGCFAARSLAGCSLKAAVLESREDVCTGISRANTAVIYAGYDTSPNTLKSRLCVSGCLGFDTLCAELGVDFNRCGSIMTAVGPRGENVLEKKYAHGLENKVPGMSLISGDEARGLEPALSKDITKGLYCTETGTVLPWELGIAAFENARENGIDFLFNESVKAMAKSEDGFVIETQNSSFYAGFIINCAGLYADAVREMLFPPKVRLFPTKGDYLVLDTTVSSPVSRVIFCEPEEKGKGLTIVPTITGDILAGPSEIPAEGKQDWETDPAGIDFVLEGLKRALPDFDSTHVIRSFSALRPNPYYVTENSDGTFSPENKSINSFTVLEDLPNFISFVGIKTPGLTSCAVLGALAAEKAAGFFSADKNPNFDPVRPRPVRVSEMTICDRDALIKSDPAFGKIICRCREITEGEIVSAVRRGAVTLDGVKRRVRALSGRCQGSFCTQGIIEIIARETAMPPHTIMKDGPGSYILEDNNGKM